MVDPEARAAAARVYQNPLVERYASREMAENFSAFKKFTTWRRLWIALAEAERDLGLPITGEQIAELKARALDLNLDVAEAFERETRHDVMAHIKAYGALCPKAKGIIHLGATSAYVVDNAEVLLIREGLNLLARRLAATIGDLARFAERHADLPTLGLTHFQPAQPTTVGKRACLWIQDFLMDLREIEHRLGALRCLGARGATGTEDSFLKLLGGDSAKVDALEAKVLDKAGLPPHFKVTGQTGPRKQEAFVVSAVAGIGTSATRMSNDVRILQGVGEMEEPFEEGQVGSSAMPFKKNPMRSERIAGLSRYLLVNSLNPALTASAQWFERTLDDSSNLRIALPEAFLAADAVLILAADVAAGLKVHPAVVARRLQEELPFLATETILMEAVKAGGDRQELHGRIRDHALKAAEARRSGSGAVDLLAHIEADPAFAAVKGRLRGALDPRNFIGRAPEQVKRFLEEEVGPALAPYAGQGGREAVRV